MIGLAIETSAREGSVALATGDGEMDERVLLEERGHARGLAPAIADLLSDHGLVPGDLELVVVDVGPGAYTGLRLGLATAKTLSVTLEVPLVGVPSTAVLAAAAPATESRVLAVQDARRDHVYFAMYDRDPRGTISEIEAPAVALAASLSSQLDLDPFVVGDGVPVVERVLGRQVRGDGGAVPGARWLLELGKTRFEAGERDDAHSLLPLYLRPSEAERLWTERRAGGST